jgi:CubicO group peptidase (beta-lactamase class C family)
MWVTLLAAVAACGSTTPAISPVTDSGMGYVPDTAWRTAVPAAVDFDGARMQALTRDVNAGRYGAIDGVVVVRRGYLVLEHYRNWSRDRAHTMQSVSKSVTSLLVGLAMQSKPGFTLDRPVVDLFTRYGPLANDDARKHALTMRHLLTMRTGMDFWEQPYPGSPLDQLNRSSGDWVKFILDRPMVGDPGTTWAYNSGAAILACAAIREATGEAADVFAARELFRPIGIRGETCYRSPFDGLPHCGGGLNLRPVDLARIGYLVLRGGRWGDIRLVPQAWIEESTRPISRGNPVFFSSYGSAYGYFWWLFPTTRGGIDTGVITASGSGGQWLFVVPSLDLVVVVVATEGAGLELLYDGVLPAIRR